jgi:hypothetical protein
LSGGIQLGEKSSEPVISTVVLQMSEKNQSGIVKLDKYDGGHVRERWSSY